jgi:hypothetical protein
LTGQKRAFSSDFADAATGFFPVNGGASSFGRI